MLVRVTIIILFLFFASAAAIGHNDANSTTCPTCVWDRESLTSGFFGLNEALEDNGLEMTLSATQVYQQNVRGGLSTHNKSGRYSGRYDLEVGADMEKLAGIEGGSVYLLAGGRWSDGINDNSVGSIFNVNDIAKGNEPISITQLWYQQWFANETFAVRIGKLDLTGGFECRGCPVTFDGSRFANDETTQFLNSAFVNNPTIPFPQQGLGAALHWYPIEWWYASFGIGDAEADVDSAGFGTTFGGEDNFFSILETGILPQFDSDKGPLQGAYRAGIWYDPQGKTQFEDAQVKRNDAGFYLSFDQTFWKENSMGDDQQGLGAFARYGYADKSVNEITHFISGGIQYQGLFQGRDHDVIAAAIGHGLLSNDAGFDKNYETVYEAYYNARITNWMYLTPDIQYINHPAKADAANAIVVGVRLQVIF